RLEDGDALLVGPEGIFRPEDEEETVRALVQSLSPGTAAAHLAEEARHRGCLPAGVAVLFAGRGPQAAPSPRAAPAAKPQLTASPPGGPTTIPRTGSSAPAAPAAATVPAAQPAPRPAAVVPAALDTLTPATEAGAPPHHTLAPGMSSRIEVDLHWDRGRGLLS